MGLKPKHFWYCVPVIGFVLSFFFGVSPPKDWGAALSFMAPAESWWAAHAAHPLLAAFLCGIIVRDSSISRNLVRPQGPFVPF